MSTQASETPETGGGHTSVPGSPYVPDLTLEDYKAAYHTLERELSAANAAKDGLVEALRMFTDPLAGYDDADLQRCADCKTGRGEFAPSLARAHLKARAALARANGEAS